jgi:hypothetical protein
MGKKKKERKRKKKDTQLGANLYRSEHSAEITTLSSQTSEQFT